MLTPTLLNSKLGTKLSIGSLLEVSHLRRNTERPGWSGTPLVFVICVTQLLVDVSPENQVPRHKCRVGAFGPLPRLMGMSGTMIRNPYAPWLLLPPASVGLKAIQT